MSDDTKKREHEIEEIDCIEAIDGLYAYLDGELNDPQTLAKFEHHLEHCSTCYSRTQLETALGQLMRKSAKATAPLKLQSRLRKIIDEL